VTIEPPILPSDLGSPGMKRRCQFLSTLFPLSRILPNFFFFTSQPFDSATPFGARTYPSHLRSSEVLSSWIHSPRSLHFGKKKPNWPGLCNPLARILVAFLGDLNLWCGRLVYKSGILSNVAIIYTRPVLFNTRLWLAFPGRMFGR
jgi:hypothetical protein